MRQGQESNKGYTSMVNKLLFTHLLFEACIDFYDFLRVKPIPLICHLFPSLISGSEAYSRPKSGHRCCRQLALADKKGREGRGEARGWARSRNEDFEPMITREFEVESL